MLFRLFMAAVADTAPPPLWNLAAASRSEPLRCSKLTGFVVIPIRGDCLPEDVVVSGIVEYTWPSDDAVVGMYISGGAS